MFSEGASSSKQAKNLTQMQNPGYTHANVLEYLSGQAWNTILIPESIRCRKVDKN